MRYLQLTLGSGGAVLHPLFSLLTDSDCVDGAWMLDWNAVRRETTTTLFRVAGDTEPFATALDEHEVVLNHEVTASEDGTFYAYIHTEAVEMERKLWSAFSQKRSLLVPPLEYDTDGTVTCRIVGTAGELRAALSDIPSGIDVTVDRTGEFTGRLEDGAAVLTDRQLETVHVAIEIGYYEIPRRATAADVASRLGCTPSTASEHLRKAEARIVPVVIDT